MRLRLGLPFCSRVGLPSLRLFCCDTKPSLEVGVLRPAVSAVLQVFAAREVWRWRCFSRRSCFADGLEPYRLRLFFPAGNGRSSRDQLPPAASGPRVGISGGGILSESATSPALRPTPERQLLLEFCDPAHRNQPLFVEHSHVVPTAAPDGSSPHARSHMMRTAYARIAVLDSAIHIR